MARNKPQDGPTIWRVGDALWAELRPPLMTKEPRTKPGRSRLGDGPIFDGPPWLAHNGGQWATLPRAFGAKSTPHARFREWGAHGSLARAWARLLEVYDDEVALDWQRHAADAWLVKALFFTKGSGEPEATGADPADRSKYSVKRHPQTDLLDAVVYESPAVGERHLCLDRGYGYAACRETAGAHGHTPCFPPKCRAAYPPPAPGDHDRHPPRRWTVEVAHSWFNRSHRQLIRREKRATNYLGFVQLAACLNFYRKPRHARSLSG